MWLALVCYGDLFRTDEPHASDVPIRNAPSVVEEKSIEPHLSTFTCAKINNAIHELESTGVDLCVEGSVSRVKKKVSDNE